MAGEEAPDPPVEELAERYDFDRFGPREFEAMSREEWELAFDAERWVTGPELLDRVERELRARIDRRDVFAVLERITDGGERCLLAYSDEGYALVRPTGDVEGFGAVLRDVKPSVALCSIPDYEPAPLEATSGELPDPAAIETGVGDLGNQVLQVIGLALVLGGLGLVAGAVFLDVPLFGFVLGVIFLLVAGFLLFTVANARLSERYRAEEYRDRLRSVGLGEGERPPFVPPDEAAEPGDDAR